MLEYLVYENKSGVQTLSSEIVGLNDNSIETIVRRNPWCKVQATGEYSAVFRAINHGFPIKNGTPFQFMDCFNPAETGVICSFTADKPLLPAALKSGRVIDIRTCSHTASAAPQ